MVETESSATEYDRVRAWLRVREPLERQLEPLGRVAIERLNIRSGERVLDIGCGIGGTPAALADAAKPGGHVTGIDLLPEAIHLLRRECHDRPALDFIIGDAANHAFPPLRYDAAFSRFGVMFFSEPVAAFANIRAALRPGGRLGFICWRSLEENELDDFPLRAAAVHLPTELLESARTSQHFTFADPHYMTALLSRAGFDKIEIRANDQLVGSGGVEPMIDVCSAFGSLGKILRDHPTLKPQAIRALRRALEGLVVGAGMGDGPTLNAATWVVTATNPA